MTQGFAHKFKTAVKLIARGDFQTLISRTKVALLPTMAPKPISQNIAPRERPLTTRPVGPKRDRRKVLVCGRSLDRHGAQISLSEILCPLAPRLASNGIDIELCVLDDTGPLKDDYEGIIKVEILTEFPRNMSLPDVYEADIINLAKQLSRRAPNMIYVNSIDMFPVVDAARVAGIPTLWNVREAQDWRVRLADRHPDIIARALACFAYPKKMLFVSQSAKNAWAHYVPNGQSAVIKTAIQEMPTRPEFRQTIRQKWGVPDEALLFVTIGTLAPAKGQRDIALAMSHLSPDMRDHIHWLFVGSGVKDYIQKMKQNWPPLHWRSQVHLAGYIGDCTPYYAAADYLVSSSLTEAMPRNILEAKMSGLPIISTNIDGACEALGDYEAAMLYPAGDTIALSACIENGVRAPYSRVAPSDEGGEAYQAMLAIYERYFKEALAL